MSGNHAVNNLATKISCSRLQYSLLLPVSKAGRRHTEFWIVNGRYCLVHRHPCRGSFRIGSLCRSRLLRLQTNKAHRIFPILDYDHSCIIADHNLRSEWIIRFANQPGCDYRARTVDRHPLDHDKLLDQHLNMSPVLLRNTWTRQELPASGQETIRVTVS